MTHTSREKLNAIHLQGSIFLAAIFAALTGSWWLFILVAVGLISSSIYAGEIRPASNRRH